MGRGEWCCPSGPQGPHRSRDLGRVLTGGRTLASTGYDGTVRLWDPVVLREKVAIQAHAGQVQRLSFSSKENLLATPGNDLMVRVWRLPE